MNIKEFSYITKEGDNTPRKVLVLEEDNNYIKGIDLLKLKETTKNEIISTFEHLDSLIKENIDSFRCFKMDSIADSWNAYITKNKIIVSKFDPDNYGQKMSLEEAIEWQKNINNIPIFLTGNENIDSKIRNLSENYIEK